MIFKRFYKVKEVYQKTFQKPANSTGRRVNIYPAFFTLFCIILVLILAFPALSFADNPGTKPGSSPEENPGREPGVNSLTDNTANPGPSAEYDYILVIDESGSMKRNDPAEVRKDAAKLFTYLAEVLNPGNRVLVAGFGEKTNIYLPLTEVEGNEEKNKLSN